MTKKFILNADDFGMSKALNRAVLEGYNSGILKSVSLVANGESFEDALNNVLSVCPDLGVGIHLNLTDGVSLCQDLSTLTNENGEFNNSYLQLLIKSYNPKETEFLEQVEREFRRQIEKVMSKTKVFHIDSHNHIHTIPKIFDIVCRLAKEYGIKQVRTHFEKFYFVPDVRKHLGFRYISNLFKIALFNIFTVVNENIVHKYELKTNDYIIGIGYTSMMDALSVAYGLYVIKYNSVTVESIIHPCRYDDGTVNNYFEEFLLTKNKKLKEKIESLGYEITNYVEKDS
ncbi:ChbG/HpnK family deacetylase [bacterium]|nr:ChbG/HpnK family deacetylase [bacterium]